MSNETIEIINNGIHKGDFVLITDVPEISHKIIGEPVENINPSSLPAPHLFYVKNIDETGINVVKPIFMNRKYHFTWNEDNIMHYAWEYFQMFPYEICTDKVPTFEMEKALEKFDQKIENLKSKFSRYCLYVALIAIVVCITTGFIFKLESLTVLVSITGILLLVKYFDSIFNKIYVTHKLKSEMEAYGKKCVDIVHNFHEYKNEKKFLLCRTKEFYYDLGLCTKEGEPLT